MNQREQLIQRAIGERRISAAQADEYRRLYDAQPEIITRLLTASSAEGGLMPGLADAHAFYEGATDYPDAWLTPGERSALAARRTTAPAPPPAAPAPTQASSSAEPPPAGDDYEQTWLTPAERNRITAAKDGSLDHGPIQFEDAAARSAAGHGVATR